MFAFNSEREEIATKLLMHRINRGCMTCTFEDWWINYVLDKDLYEEHEKSLETLSDRNSSET